MGVSEILAQIDREIAQLQQARALLGGKAAAALRQPPPPRNPSRRREILLLKDGSALPRPSSGAGQNRRRQHLQSNLNRGKAMGWFQSQPILRPAAVAAQNLD